MSKVYLIGSLKEKRDRFVAIANLIEARGHEVFADWHAPGPAADVYWQEYETARGRSFIQAIRGPHARHVFQYDKRWLDWCEAAVMVCPAGKSAHWELGYVHGRGRATFIYLDGEPARWDVMLAGTTGIYDNLPDLLEVL